MSRGVAGSQGRHGEVVVPVTQDDHVVIAAGEGRVAVRRDGADLPRCRLRRATRHDARRPRGVRLDPGDAGVGDAEGRSDVDGVDP